MKSCAITLLTFLFFLPLLTAAQDSLSSKYYLNNDRSWLLEIPIWIPLFTGELAFGDVTFSSADDSGDDEENESILSDLDLAFYFVGRGVYETDQWYANFDAFSGRLIGRYSADRIIKPGQIELVSYDIQATILRLNGGYKVYRFEKGDLAIDITPYVGLRFMDVPIKSQFLDTTFTANVRPQWFEPLIGIYIPLMYKRILFNQSVDIGVDGNTNTWMYIAQFQYRFSPLFDAKLGWSYLNLLHKESLENVDINMNIILSGPSLGVGFRF